MAFNVDRAMIRLECARSVLVQTQVKINSDEFATYTDRMFDVVTRGCDNEDVTDIDPGNPNAGDQPAAGPIEGDEEINPGNPAAGDLPAPGPVDGEKDHRDETPR